MNGYRKFILNETGSPTYIKEKSVEALRNVDAIVFDCDGVLLDTQESYDVCIKETTRLLIKALSGQTIPIQDEYIYKLRDTGGFNNDWNITYALIQYALTSVLSSQKPLLSSIYKFALDSPMFERYNSIKNETNKIIINMKLPSFDSFVKNLDATGVESLKKYLIEVDPHFSELVRQILSYPGEINESMLIHLFEEIFCGSALFKNTYGYNTTFTETKGLIYNEKIVVSIETLETLRDNCSGRLGIASGSKKAFAETILRELIEYFRQDATVWMDDVNEEITRTGQKGLHKPDPYSLNRAAGALEPFSSLLYIGDTQADLTMALQS